MRTFVRILTTIVVLIVFTTAAGLRASDTRRITSQEPLLINDVATENEFDSPLGITTRVGYQTVPLIWDALETALTQFDIGFDEGAFVPSLDFTGEAFGLALIDQTTSQVNRIFDEVESGFSNASLASSFNDTFDAPIVLSQTSGPVATSGRAFGSQNFGSSSDLFTIVPRNVVYEDIMITRFQQTSYASPVPLPAAFPMLAAALGLFGLIRCRP
jgi:hypothetical protein